MTVKKQIPLLKDHHSHPYTYASFRNCIGLNIVYNKEDALSLIRESDKEITVVTGWNNSYYSFTNEELDSLAPVVVCNISFHGYLINKPAKEKLYNSFKDVVENIDDNAWVERNLYSIFKFIANINPCDSRQVKAFFDTILLPSGVWYVEEMLLPNENVIDIFREIGYLERIKFWADIDTYNSLDKDKQSDIHGIKIFTDGALGAKTAALKTPFLTGEEGVLNYSDDELYNLVSRSVDTGKALSIHAIGDRADNQVITVLNNFKAQRGSLPPARMEHCQFISQENAEKAKELGITLSMQPNFNSDSLQYTDRIAKVYCKNNNPFRMLIDKVGFVPGEDLIFGSDGMPHGVQYALEQTLFPPVPGQVLSLEEFVAGYCMPDMENGYIDVEIDEEQKNVLTRVVLKTD